LKVKEEKVPKAYDEKDDGAYTGISQVLDQGVSTILFPNYPSLQHGKATLHEEDHQTTDYCETGIQGLI